MPTPWGQVGVSGIADTAWSSANALAPTNPLRSLARHAFHASTWLTAFHDNTNNDLTRYSTGAYVYPDITNMTLAGFSKAAQSQSRWATVYQRVTTWANAAAAGAYDATSATESSDVDLDGEPEFLLFNKRLFVLFERIGGRMTAAWVRDLTSGKVFQTVGNPIAYAGFETEEEGYANVLGGVTGSYRTSGFKDWYASGPNTLYTNDYYTATPATNGFTFTSSDGKVTKTITLASSASALHASYTLDPTITTLFLRHGLSPHLDELLRSGQTNLGALTESSGTLSVTTTAADAGVRAFITLGTATYNVSAVDDDAGQGALFDTLNMRDQAQTQQVELSLTSGASFDLGFEVLGNPDADNDTLPDAWEAANGLSSSDATGANGPTGNPDGDGLTNLQEYIVGKNPQAADSYMPGIAKTTNGFTVSFSTIPDRLYRVYASDDLVFWTALGTDFSGDGSVKSYEDAPGSLTRRFYHVVVRLP
jgi:hypothetical protein